MPLKSQVKHTEQTGMTLSGNDTVCNSILTMHLNTKSVRKLNFVTFITMSFIIWGESEDFKESVWLEWEVTHSHVSKREPVRL